jgi:hypothetical protein
VRRTTTGTCVVWSNIVTATVRPVPTASVSVPPEVCLNQPSPAVTFTNPLNLPITVTYNINGGTNQTVNIGANTTATVSAPTNTIGTFTYNLVNAYYQTAPACTAGVTGSSAITVHPLPAAPIIAAGGPTSFCAGLNVTITSNQSSGNTWSNSATSQSITVGTAGNYTATFTDGNNCTSLPSSPVTVALFPFCNLTWTGIRLWYPCP